MHAALQTNDDPCSADLTRFRTLIDAFRSTIMCDEPSFEPLPEGLPDAGAYPGRDQPISQAPAELATLAAGWAFLHETRHIRHQQEGTSTPPGGSPKQFHDEEFSCDEFAARFLVERHGDYARDQSVDADRVLRKRRAGLSVALFALALTAENNWQETDRHPSIQSRMNALRSFLGNSAEDNVMIIGAFMALRCIWPEVPMPRF